MYNYTCVAEYIWLDANKKFRSKTKVIPKFFSGVFSADGNDISVYPRWDYDGSSTGQASGTSSEVILVPIFVCDNPLLQDSVTNINSNHVIMRKLVLCETFHVDGKPTSVNTRHAATTIFDVCLEQKPWFGLEQEYFIFDDNTYNEENKKWFYEMGMHYCGVGCQVSHRQLVEEHMAACLTAGLTISGINAEVSMDQWEFQIGPTEGVRAADELLVARYLLERIAEKYGKTICYDPKPFTHINGSGCHTNFSTTLMRDKGGIGIGGIGGINEIHRVIQNMEKHHAEDIQHYGKDNDKRLSGIHETSSYDKFSWGVANRGASVRINSNTHRDGFGYFEDRRPAANMDPYLVTSILMQRVIDE
jgi:glutamine synthetase